MKVKLTIFTCFSKVRIHNDTALLIFSIEERFDHKPTACLKTYQEIHD